MPEHIDIAKLQHIQYQLYDMHDVLMRDIDGSTTGILKLISAVDILCGLVAALAYQVSRLHEESEQNKRGDVS
jgi:hypothetical protein